MTTIKVRKPCARCTNGRGVALCNGCDQMFCINHFTEHREELSKLMDNISQEHDFFQSELRQENLEHPFLSRINTWEEESIKKIQTTAQTARIKLEEIFNRKKNETKPTIEHLANELLAVRDSADYTETDIKKWTDKLKILRDTFKDWSSVNLENDNQSESIIHLIRISNTEDRSPLSRVMSSEHPIEHVEGPSDFDEQFDKNNSNVDITDDNLRATCRSRLLFSNRFIYGMNRYSIGKHSVHFAIEKKGEALLFFGIITASKTYDQSFLNPNNSSVFGWYNMKLFVSSGISQGYHEENNLSSGDELTLMIDCDEHQIILQHHRSKRLFQLPVQLDKCPFPWKILVGLSNFHDCIRIIT